MAPAPRAFYDPTDVSIVRTALPILALTAGTALGLRGSPLGSASAPAYEVGTVAPPPNADPPPPVDPSQLPDPGPWPRLNPECNLGKAWLLAEGPAHESGDGRRFVTLTFDDGPRPETTPEILRLLRQYRVTATFFFIGRYLEGDKPRNVLARDVARQVVAEGHLVGSHTRDHMPLASLTRTQALGEIDDGIDDVAAVTGKPPSLFRPPYGQLDAFTEDHLRARGLELVMWSVEASDMKSSDEDAMAGSLEEQLDFAGGGVVLLHDVRRSTVGTLARLLEWLKARRYDPARPSRPGFVLVDWVTYTRETAAHPQTYSDRAALESARAADWRKLHPQRRAPADVLDENEPY